MPSSTAFTRETVQLDGEYFDDCEFKKCRMVYAGGEAPAFVGCRFEDCDWKFEDAAARTLCRAERHGVQARPALAELVEHLVRRGPACLST